MCAFQKPSKISRSRFFITTKADVGYRNNNGFLRQQCYRIKRLRPEHEIDRADQTEARPNKIQFERLVHIKHGEGNEHGQRDDLLQYFQLRQVQFGVANEIGWNLELILEKCDTPTQK